MFVVRAEVDLGFSLGFDNNISDTDWLMICACDRWYVSLFALYLLTPKKSSIYISSVIFILFPLCAHIPARQSIPLHVLIPARWSITW